jgi:hypothetical protein
MTGPYASQSVATNLCRVTPQPCSGATAATRLVLRRFAFAGLLALFGTAGTAAAGFIDLPNGERVFNSGHALVGGQVDLNYLMTLNPYAPGSSNAFVSAGAGYLSSNTAASSWLSPAGVNVNAPDAPSTYRIQTSVDLSGIDISGFSLYGYWVSDNQGLDILVNGHSTGQTNSGQHSSAVDAFPGNRFTLSEHLVSGLNVIEFAWVNVPFGPTNPVHIRVEFRGYEASAVPEPASATLWGLGAAMLTGFRLRPRKNRLQNLGIAERVGEQ